MRWFVFSRSRFICPRLYTPQCKKKKDYLLASLGVSTKVAIVSCRPPHVTVSPLPPHSSYDERSLFGQRVDLSFVSVLLEAARTNSCFVLVLAFILPLQRRV